MGYPPPQDPYGQQTSYGQQPVPYPPQQPQPYAHPQQAPMKIQQVGMSVTKPAWTVGDMLWIFFTGGIAWPFIWAKRRSKTTITRHR